MKEWMKISLILCSFGFFRELRPNEPYAVEFLSGEWRDLTIEQLNKQIFPFGTYSYLALLCIVFLITDILRYKPIIIASAVSALGLFSLMLWTSSIVWVYCFQLCYGFFMAAEVAYYTYMYAKVDKDHYQRVTGQARASLLIGRFLGSVLAQVIYSYKLMNVRQLNFISLGTQAVSLPIALCLPSVGISIYMWSYDSGSLANGTPLSATSTEGTFSQDTFSSIEKTSISSNLRPKFSWTRAKKLLWEHFIQAYTDKTVLIWSIWWSLAMGGFLQIQSYIQILWEDINQQSSAYNGGVEAALTLCGAISCLIAGYVPSETFEKYDMWILMTCSLVEGAVIIFSSFTSEVWIAYACYVVFGVTYMFMITLASATVAKNLADDSFALIFGVNTLVAVIFQSILTVTVISESGFELPPRKQFLVFGSYFIVLAVVYFIGSIVKQILKMKQK